ncbi:hypothetical protein F4779DRAFT_110951 [Xylariaceae sp. FL0662B]|nr:hypothetical protein F4779DRAFT_110951 [Xylariaceae sp. FL0662B]
MTSFPSSSLSPRQHRSGPSEIASLYLACDFLDFLHANGNVSKDTLVVTPDLQTSPLPAFRNNQDRPVNATLANGSFNAQNKGCQIQWEILHSLTQKIDVYYQELQCLGRGTLPVLRHWLRKCRQSRRVREVGLHALRDILQGNYLIQFDEILCAMLVQHAVFIITKTRRPIERDIGSALAGWRNMRSLTQHEQSILDSIFEQITIYDNSFPGDSNPAWPDHGALLGSTVQGTGSIFNTDGFTQYPMAISNSSLADEHTDMNRSFHADASSWTQNSMTGYSPRMHHHTMATHLNQPPEVSPYTQWRPGESSSAMSMNVSLVPNVFGLQPAYPRQPHSSGPVHMFQSSQPPSLLQRRTQVDTGPFNQSPPFNIFMNFIDDFGNLGGLLHLFSHIGRNPIHLTNQPTNANAQASEMKFSMDAETHLFQPLKASRHIPDPLAQAIVSTARSLARVRGLRSFKDIEDYIIHLSVNLLPSFEPCRTFVRVVLQTCSDIAPEVGEAGDFTNLRNQNHYIEERLDKLTGRFFGVYYPAQVLHQRSYQSRGYERLQPAGPPLRSSSSYPTSPLGNSASSDRRNNRDASTITSTTDELYVTAKTSFDTCAANETSTGTTPSASSESRCPKCSQVFTGKYITQSLSRHKRKHKEEIYQCPSEGCPKLLDSRTDNIRTHCKNVHNLELPKGTLLWRMLKKVPSPASSTGAPY